MKNKQVATIPKLEPPHNIYKLIFAMRRNANDIVYGFDEPSAVNYNLSPFTKSNQSIVFEKKVRVMATVYRSLPEFFENAQKIGETIVEEILKIKHQFRREKRVRIE